MKLLVTKVFLVLYTIMVNSNLHSLPSFSLQSLRELKRGNGKHWNIGIADTYVLLRKVAEEENVEKTKMEEVS